MSEEKKTENNIEKENEEVGMIGLSEFAKAVKNKMMGKVKNVI